MMRKVCAFCRFFELRTPVAFPQAAGTCHRNSPRGPAIAGSGWEAFPPVGVNSWCGDYLELRQGLPATQDRMDQLTQWIDARGGPTSASAVPLTRKTAP